MSLAAVALGGAIASSASAASLTAHRVTADGQVLGQADATTFAYAYGGSARSDVVAFDRVVLRGDDGRSRTVAAPAGCQVSVAQNALLAGECGPRRAIPSSWGDVMRNLFVARLDGTLVTRLDVVGRPGADGIGPDAPTSVGAQWIGSPNYEHGGHWTDAVNWHTGEARSDRQSAAGAVEDVNAPDLQAPLCAPVERVPRVDEAFHLPPDHFSAEAHGRYVLLQTTGSSYSVRRCGSTRPVSLPKGFQPRALSSGWVAGATKVDGTLRVDVVRLANGRRYSVKGAPRTGFPVLTFTRGRLYLGAVGASVRPIYTVKLPKARA